MPTRAETILPTDNDARQARETRARLNSLVAREPNATSLQVRAGDAPEASVPLPAPVLQALLDVLETLGAGQGVRITPVTPELTTQQAADLLGVSRPHLIAHLLDTGVLPSRRVGNRRRIRTTDLLRYRQEREAERQQGLDELVAEAQRLSMY